MLSEVVGAEQLELLEVMARALAKLGMRRVPLVEPTQSYFPDEYEPDLVCVGELLHRLMSLAGVALEIDVVDGRPPMEELPAEQLAVTQPNVELVAIENGRAVFQVDRLGPGDLTVAALCHEVARASLGTDGDRKAAAAATIVHGFGLITLPAASSYRRSSKLTGDYVVTRQNLVLTGALASGELAFLLAVWLVLRGGDEREVLKQYLAPEPAANVEKWMDALAGERPALREKLKLPYSDERAIAKVPSVPPVPEKLLQKLEQLEEQHRQPHQGKVGVRIWEPQTGMYTWIGVILSFFGAIPLLVNERLVAWAWAPLVAGVIGGRMVGRRRRRWSCGGCGMRLHVRDHECPKCGARLERDKKRVTRVADMEDDDGEDDALTREALAAGGAEEDEAD